MAKTNDSKKKEGFFAGEFNKLHSETRKTVCEIIGFDPTDERVKARGLGRKETLREWSELRGKEPSYKDHPKTDVLIESPDHEPCRLSLKNVKGRATSSKYGETKALFYSVFEQSPERSKNLGLLASIDDLFDVWSQPEGAGIPKEDLHPKFRVGPIKSSAGIGRKLKKWPRLYGDELEQFLDSQKGARKVLNLAKYGLDVPSPKLKFIRDNYPDFMLNVIAEAIRGNLKYGKDNVESATHLGVFDAKKSDRFEFKHFSSTSDNDLDFAGYCKKELDDDNNFKIQTKTGGTGKAVWLRFM